MNKVILILSDALRYAAAVIGVGFLGHLVENRLASLYKLVTGDHGIDIAPTICRSLDVPIPGTMKAIPLI